MNLMIMKFVLKSTCYYFDSIMKFEDFDCITYVLFNYYEKIEIGSYDSLPIEKTLTRHNVIVLIQSGPNKDQSHYYYNMFLKKYSSQLEKIFND